MLKVTSLIGGSVIVAQWNSSLWPGFNSQPRRSISRDFSLADHNLSSPAEPVGQKMAQSLLNDTNNTCGQLGGRPRSRHG